MDETVKTKNLIDRAVRDEVARPVVVLHKREVVGGSKLLAGCVDARCDKIDPDQPLAMIPQEIRPAAVAACDLENRARTKMPVTLHPECARPPYRDNAIQISS